jgi:asparagine synthase (glutamine-hydrolysing)
MCGINGFIGNDPQKIERMNNTLSHRGPDYAGIYTDDSVSLGHTLLSIREVTKLSSQPYTKEGSPWILLFNGQIYNTKQIKENLDQSYKDTDLDTALLFALIEKYGLEFIDKIHGMFAIALYHKRDRTINLYRDPSGQKNIYYYQGKDGFAFSSEIQPLIDSGINNEVDEMAVILSANLGYIPGDKTLFANIKKLPAGGMFTFNCETKEGKLSYFKSDTKNYYGYKSPKEVMQELINEHFQSKQKVAINLSGGLDSSILLHEAAKAGHNLYTYTNFFETDNEKYNRDAILARKLAEDYGSKHTEIIITKNDFLNNFTKSYTTIEEPNYNITLPAYLLTAIKEGVNGDNNRVILSGDGGDEVFGGYPDYLKSAQMDRMRHIITPLLFDILKNYRNHTPMFYHFGNQVDRWLFFKRLSFNALKKNEDVRDYLSLHLNKYRDNYTSKKGSQYNMMVADIVFWMTSENFIRSDKLYMSQSLEMRSPFGYEPFRTYMDNHLKESDYVSKKQNKNFIRNLYDGVLPDYITKRSDKSGWRAPIAIWYNQEFKDLFLEMFNEAKRSGGNLIDWNKVIKMVEEKEGWPGKYTHLYFSLAALSNKYKLSI